MRLLLIIGSLFITTYISYTQFLTIPNFTEENLNDVYLIDSTNGVIVGENGLILMTENAGNNWSVVHTKQGVDLQKVKFFDDKNGLIVGKSNELLITPLLITSDGGYNWSEINNPNQAFYDIAILNDSVCVVSGDLNSLIKTTDRGKTWKTLIENNISLGSLSFINENIGYSTSQGGGNIILSKTTDGGETWDKVYHEPTDFNTIISSLVFTDEENGFRAGYYTPHLMKTSNKGLNWNEPLLDEFEDNSAIIDFHIIPDQTKNYFACGWYGIVLKSTDSGESWERIGENIPKTEKLNSVYLLNDSYGIIVGDGGIIVKLQPKNEEVTSVSDNIENNLMFYPNPSSNTLILYDDYINNNVLIYNMNGELMQKVNNKTYIDISNYPIGYYLIKIEGKSSMFFKN